MSPAPTHLAAQSPTPSAARRIKTEGNIGDVFASFSGGDSILPIEYARFKREIVDSPERAARIVASWNRLLIKLEEVTAEIEAKGGEVSK